MVAEPTEQPTVIVAGAGGTGSKVMAIGPALTTVPEAVWVPVAETLTVPT